MWETRDEFCEEVDDCLKGAEVFHQGSELLFIERCLTGGY